MESPINVPLRVWVRKYDHVQTIPTVELTLLQNLLLHSYCRLLYLHVYQLNFLLHRPQLENEKHTSCGAGTQPAGYGGGGAGHHAATWL